MYTSVKALNLSSTGRRFLSLLPPACYIFNTMCMCRCVPVWVEGLCVSLVYIIILSIRLFPCSSFLVTVK